MKTLRIAAIAAACLAAACSGNDGAVSLSSYVDPRIGSGEHGHVFVGAGVPFGMVNLGPTSIPQTWDWCSGYHESDSTVIGFSHTHLSGTGIGDLFDVTLMPVVGEVAYSRGAEPSSDAGASVEEAQATGMWSYADRTREVVRPGYYRVPLLRYGVDAEMTVTKRVGLSRYTFPASDSSAVVIDLENGGCWDSPAETGFKVVSPTAVEGYRFSRGWAKDQKVFFHAEFSRPFDSFVLKGESGRYGRACFKTGEGERIMVKVSLSAVSEQGARANMEAELPGWDFEATAQAALKAWDSELSRIKAQASDPVTLKVFYTSLFHTMIHPTLFSDVNGDYRGADGQVHNAGRDTYTVFSLWDVYRANMPLMTIIDPERYSDFVNTMVSIFDEQGKLPVWHLWGCETDCMVGNPAIPVVADAIVKDIPGVDKEKAFEAMKATAMLDDRGQGERRKYGYMPAETIHGALAEDMECAIADGALATAARCLGKDEDEEYFTRSSHSYRNYFDPGTLFMRGKYADGSWVEPFNPYYSNHSVSVYVEGNAWQYTWLAPQDLDGLVQLYGSREKTVERLDSLFAASSRIDGEHASSDMTGLVGQYVHGNEPSHHIIYFYTMLGQPWKTADLVRQVLTTLYDATPSGIAGNEDAGQMSAWYVLSAMGLYQVEPAGARYWFGSPILDKAEIAVPGGRFTIIAKDNSPSNKYIKKVTLNGKPYDKWFIDYSDIVKGGELVFEMCDKQCEL